MAIAISRKFPTTDAMKTGRSSGSRNADSSIGFRPSRSTVVKIFAVPPSASVRLLNYKNGSDTIRTMP